MQTTSSNSGYTIDRAEVVLPTLIFTNEAKSQLELILENDFTLSGKYLRILISGKGCDGFKYSIGFHDMQSEDFLVRAENMDLEVAIDPFTAFYLGETGIDYKFEPESGDEGFIVTNKSQEQFEGKFWRTNKDLIPPESK